MYVLSVMVDETSRVDGLMRMYRMDAQGVFRSGCAENFVKMSRECKADSESIHTSKAYIRIDSCRKLFCCLSKTL